MTATIERSRVEGSTNAMTEERILQLTKWMMGRGAPIVRDDLGFDGPGHALANAALNREASLTPADYRALAETLARFPRQMGDFGQDAAELRQYAADHAGASRFSFTAHQASGKRGWLVGFKYDPDVIERLRSMGARWNNNTRSWFVSEELLPNLTTMLARYGEIAPVLEAGPLPVVPARQAVTVTTEGNLLRIAFDYDSAIVAAVKQVPGRRFDGDTKTWTVPADAGAALRAALATAGHRVEVPGVESAAEPVVVEAPRIQVLDEGARLRILTPGYNAEWVAAIKTVGGRQFDPADKAWTVPATKAAELKRAFLKVGIDYLLPEVDDTGSAPSAAPQLGAALEAARRHTRLFGHQQEAVAFMIQQGSTILADSMGLGKTASSIHAAHEQAGPDGRILCIVPASLRINWAREWVLWLGEAAGDIAVVTESKRMQVYRSVEGRAEVVEKGKLDLARAGTRVLVVNYDLLGKLEAGLKAFVASGVKVALLDEAHAIKNNSQRTGQVLGRSSTDGGKRKRIPGLIANVPHVHCLTGTPVTSRPMDLFNLLKAVGHPLGENYYSYGQRFCGPTLRFGHWDYSGSSNLDELSAEVADRFLQRRKEDVLDLPAKLRGRIFVDIDMDEYKAAWVSFLEAYALEHGQPLSPEHQTLVKLNVLRHQAAKQKIDAVVAKAEEIVEAGEKCVIFSNYTAVVDALAERFGPDASMKIVGGVSLEKRQANVDRFQNDPTCKVAICNLIAGGTGITLTAATHVIMADLDWVPASHMQAEDRCIAEGQLVHTLEAGLIPIEEVQVGQHVLTHEGNWKAVLETKGREHRGLMTEITYTRYSEPLLSTHDHKILVKRGAAEPAWMPASEVLPGDFLVMPRPKGGPRLETLELPTELRHDPLQVNQFGNSQRNGRYRPMPDSVVLDEDTLFLLGWYLAEGFASIAAGKGRFVSLSGHRRERPILERLGGVLAGWGARWTIYENPRTQGIELRAYSIELARWFHGMFGHGAWHKRIPATLMQLPAEQAVHLIEGYVSGDGYRRNRQVEWTSASRALAAQIALLALRCGEAPTLRQLRTAQNMGKWTGCYTVDGRPDSQALSTCDERYVYQPVRSVTTRFAQRRPKTMVYDLSVADDHSFVVGQAIVHNCYRIGQTRVVNVHYFIAAGTHEETVMDILDEKTEIVRQVEAGAITTADTLRETVQRIVASMKGRL